jgi:subtilisin family serine protease
MRPWTCICGCAVLLLLAGSPSAAEVGHEALVKFRKGATESSVSSVLAAHDLAATKRFDWLSAQRGQEYLLVRSDGKSAAQLVEELKSDPRIEAVAPNGRKRLLWPAPPNDVEVRKLWGLDCTGQVVNGGTTVPGSDVRWRQAQFLSRVTDAEAIVAVLDTGVDIEHPDLAQALWRNPGEDPTNGVDDDANGYVDDCFGYDFAGDHGGPPDSYPADVGISPGHGTHVAGTIGAVVNNGYGIAGFHPRIRIMALKGSPDGVEIDNAATIAALDYAGMMKGRGFNIVSINASFGGSDSSAIERDAFAAVGDAGIVVCAAAGNSGANNDTQPEYPASYDASNIVVVAASTPDNRLAAFSNRGAVSVDLAAPGTNIYSCQPAHVSSQASVVRDATTYTAVGMSYSGITTGITATLHYCGLGYATSFPAAVRGNIALIERGTLFFSEKTANAEAAGAVAAVIYDNQAGIVSGSLQNPDTWLPAVAISQADGMSLVAMGTTTVTVINRANPAAAFGFLYGTSMATPHVAGAVGLIALSYPDETATGRIARILSNVDVAAAYSGQVRSGGRLNVARAIDTDQDSLPDWWETEAAGNLTAMQGRGDDDGDGVNNLQEYIAGTDPLDAESYLRVVADGVGGNAPPGIAWPSAPERTYSLLGSQDAGISFSVLATNILATPPVNSCTDTAAAAESARLYTIRLE